MLTDRIAEHNDTMESVLGRLLIVEERLKAIVVKIELLEKEQDAPRKHLVIKEGDNEKL